MCPGSREKQQCPVLTVYCSVKNTYFGGRANHFKYVAAVDLEPHTGEVFASVYVGYAARGRTVAARPEHHARCDRRTQRKEENLDLARLT